jgi:hypothetical protein
MLMILTSSVFLKRMLHFFILQVNTVLQEKYMESIKQVEGSHLVRGLRAVNPWSISKHREIPVYVLCLVTRMEGNIITYSLRNTKREEKNVFENDSNKKNCIHEQIQLRFQVLTAESTQMIAFWHIAPYSLKRWSTSTRLLGAISQKTVNFTYIWHKIQQCPVTNQFRIFCLPVYCPVLSFIRLKNPRLEIISAKGSNTVVSFTRWRKIQFRKCWYKRAGTTD